MTLFNKTISAARLTISIAAFSLASSAVSAEASESLRVYAGPQSVAPGDIIHVTIEAIDAGGKSVNDQSVALNFKGAKPRIGIMKNGLTSFEIPAAQASGLMIFSAHMGDVKSQAAKVIVTTGRPEAFSLSVQPAQNPMSVSIESGIIRDRFKNQISDMTLSTLEWVDAEGLKSTRQIQLSKGQISAASACPQTFASPLTIRVLLMDVEAISKDVSALCISKKD